MDQKASRSRRLLISKNSILLLVMLVVIFLAIWAWYVDEKKATADTTSITAGSVDSVEIAVPEKVDDGTGKMVDSFPLNNDSWKTEIEFEESGYVKDLVKDVTSDGKQFVVPNFEAATGLKEGRKVITEDIWTNGLSTKEAFNNDIANDDDQYNYISLDFYLRSKSTNINLTADSFLAAGSELGLDGNGNVDPENARLLTGKKIYRQSSYGQAEGNENAFSSDAIVGAMRVSLVGAPVDGVSKSGNINSETNYGGKTWDEAAQTKVVWLPRPDIHLNTDDREINWTLTTGVKPTNTDLAKKTYCHSFYEGLYKEGNIKKGVTYHTYYDSSLFSAEDFTDADNASSPDVFKVSKGFDASKLGTLGYYPTFGQRTQVASEATKNNIQFIKGTNDSRDTTGYYVYKYTLNLWIEGEDAEARRSINNGVFSLKLSFGG